MVVHGVRTAAALAAASVGKEEQEAAATTPPFAVWPRALHGVPPSLAASIRSSHGAETPKATPLLAAFSTTYASVAGRRVGAATVATTSLRRPRGAEAKEAPSVAAVHESEQVSRTIVANRPRFRLTCSRRVGISPHFAQSNTDLGPCHPRKHTVLLNHTFVN